MGGCLSRKKEVKFKEKSKPEPAIIASPISGIVEVEDRITNGKNGTANGYGGPKAQPHETAPELPTSSQPQYTGNGYLSESVLETQHHVDESDDDEFFDAHSEWSTDLENGPEASKIDSHHQTSREPNSEYISGIHGDFTNRGNRANGEGDDLSTVR